MFTAVLSIFAALTTRGKVVVDEREIRSLGFLTRRISIPWDDVVEIDATLWTQRLIVRGRAGLEIVFPYECGELIGFATFAKHRRPDLLVPRFDWMDRD